MPPVPPRQRSPFPSNARHSGQHRRQALTAGVPQGQSHRRDTDASDGPDELVPDPNVAGEFNVSLMTLWRWTRDPALDFPPLISIRGRNFRSRRLIEQFKERLMRQAITERNAPKRGSAKTSAARTANRKAQTLA
jgi:hypothetical protein